ncbi:hypothetical protein [Bacillus phage PK2]|nr:hypothetical protein [Bacillus phage PK2]
MYKVGQKVRVIGDTFKADPHGLKTGEVYTIESISPATKFEEFPPLVKLIYAMEGLPKVDLPPRVHVKTGDGELDYANLVFEDVELVSSNRVRMLEDDFFDGYSEGDEFNVLYDDEGDGFIVDHEGDARFLVDHAHEFIS